jgi:hypothetical protein
MLILKRFVQQSQEVLQIGRYVKKYVSEKIRQVPVLTSLAIAEVAPSKQYEYITVMRSVCISFDWCHSVLCVFDTTIS